MRTSLRLVHYEDILEPRDIYSLIALTSFYNKVCCAHALHTRFVVSHMHDAPLSTTASAHAPSFDWKAWTG